MRPTTARTLRKDAGATKHKGQRLPRYPGSIGVDEPGGKGVSVAIPQDSMRVFLVTAGDGSDGDEWRLISIHVTQDGAERAKAAYEAPRLRKDGSSYSLQAQIEPWDVED